jgi:hypothetical protein
MPNVIEHGIHHCIECQRTTKQHRNLKKSSLLGLCMHVFLMFATWGLWIIPLGIYKYSENKNSQWICKDCGNLN